MQSSPARISAIKRRQQILRVAARLFARRGFNGTTTKKIAESAGVSEAIIFRHFPSKEELYWATIEEKCRNRGAHCMLAEKIQNARDEAELFTAIGVEILTRDPVVTRLLLYSALENHRLAHRFFLTRTAPYQEMICNYIRRGIKQGRFRPIDPLVAARAFVGMLYYHYHVQELFGGKQQRHFDSEWLSRTLASIWLKGMRPPENRTGAANDGKVAAANGKHLPATAPELPIISRLPQGRNGNGKGLSRQEI